MKYISICSGIEAATVAFHGLGWQPLAFSEIEAFPSAVLAAKWPDVPNLGDMTKFAEWPEEILAECDLLVGGPPCQAFSVAGLRKSLDDDRGNITLAYVRLLNHIDTVRKRHGRPPAIALYENVPGLLSTKDNAFGCLIGALAGCDEAPETESGKWPKAGYVCGETRRVGYRVLDAQYFGVAQRRRRVFLIAVPCELVASLGERSCPSEILSLHESVCGNPPTRSKAWEGTARSTSASLTSSGRGVERPGESRGQDDLVIAPRIANPLTARMGKGINTTCDEGQTLVVPAIAVRTAQTSANGHGIAEELTQTLDGAQGQAVCFPTNAVGFNWQNGGGYGKANDGLGITEEGTGPLQRCNTPAVAFTTEQTPKFSTDLALTMTKQSPTGGGQPQCVLHDAIAFSAKDYGDDSTTELSPTMRAMHHVDENANAGGQLAVAFVKATNPHSKEEAAVSACLNGWDERHDPPKHIVAFKESQSGCRTGAVHATIDANKGSRRQEDVLSAMQVRRLTPSECEFLQGFPAGHTDILFRKKPAADGPRYRALGNSMAVPCMFWLGFRIHRATQ